MNANKLVWKIMIDDKVINYSCAKCEWEKEWEYPFVFNQKVAEQVLNNHLKSHK